MGAVAAQQSIKERDVAGEAALEVNFHAQAVFVQPRTARGQPVAAVSRGDGARTSVQYVVGFCAGAQPPFQPEVEFVKAGAPQYRAADGVSLRCFLGRQGFAVQAAEHEFGMRLADAVLSGLAHEPVHLRSCG
jgi:hypothetical protein